MTMQSEPRHVDFCVETVGKAAVTLVARATKDFRNAREAWETYENRARELVRIGDIQGSCAHAAAAYTCRELVRASQSGEVEPRTNVSRFVAETVASYLEGFVNLVLSGAIPDITGDLDGIPVPPAVNSKPATGLN